MLITKGVNSFYCYIEYDGYLPRFEAGFNSENKILGMPA